MGILNSMKSSTEIELKEKTKELFTEEVVIDSTKSLDVVLLRSERTTSNSDMKATSCSSWPDVQLGKTL